MKKYTESLVKLLMTKLSQYFIIFGYLLVKKYSVLLNIINNSITFFSKYYTYFRAILLPIAQNLEGRKTMPKAKYKNIILKQILKRGTDEKSDDFWSIIIMISSKKKHLSNTSKQKSIKRKPRFEIVVINSFNNSDHKLFLTLTIIPIPNKNIVDIVRIGINAYCTTCMLKKTLIFAISIENLEFQAINKARPKTKLKNIVPKEYHDFLDVFLKKNLDTLLSH